MKSNKIPSCDPPRIFYQAHNTAQVTDQCDACSPIVFGLSSRAPSELLNTPVTVNPLLFECPIDAAHYATPSPATQRLVVLNHSAQTYLRYFTSPQIPDDASLFWSQIWEKTIAQSTLNQMVNLGLLVPQEPAAFHLTETPTTLAAWLHLTDRCNLRCAYCYLPHQPADMSFETGQAAIDATFRSALEHGYRQVKLKYAGGEPLLRFSTLTGLHRYAQMLANRHNLTLDGVVLSNGTLLTPDIVQAMKTFDLRLMISLDGLGQFHDRQRAYPNGRGSYVQVAQAIELALDNDLVSDISITVSSRNAAGLHDLIDWVLARDLPFSLNFYRENDFSAANEDLRLEEEQIIVGMLAAFKVIEARLPRRSLLPSLVDRANLASPHRRTCSVGHSYLVFDPQGQVAKCQMQLNQPLATAAAADPLALVRADKAGIQNIPVEEKEGCRSCQWKYWCTGGCPLVTYRATGRYNIKSPNCRIYKALYPAAVRLEGLRLLKYATQDGLMN